MTAILVCAVAVLTSLLVCVAVKTGDGFKDRFPPISDAEFLARCALGTRPEVALKVRKIVADHFAIEYEHVYPSMSFVEDIGAD
jgi:hypothetical protein